MTPTPLPSTTPGEVAGLQRDGWMLLDVRTDEEWGTGRIPGAVHIPMDQVVARLDEIDDRVICVCHLGGRSSRVSQYLLDQGREVRNLDGGLDAYARAGLPVEQP